MFCHKKKTKKNNNKLEVTGLLKLYHKARYTENETDRDVVFVFVFQRGHDSEAWDGSRSQWRELL